MSRLLLGGTQCLLNKWMDTSRLAGWNSISISVMRAGYNVAEDPRGGPKRARNNGDEYLENSWMELNLSLGRGWIPRDLLGGIQFLRYNGMDTSKFAG